MTVRVFWRASVPLFSLSTTRYTNQLATKRVPLTHRNIRRPALDNRPERPCHLVEQEAEELGAKPQVSGLFGLAYFPDRSEARRDRAEEETPCRQERLSDGNQCIDGAEKSTATETAEKTKGSALGDEQAPARRINPGSKGRWSGGSELVTLRTQYFLGF